MTHPRLRVLFRADASALIGAGHVMRCLTLANALAGEGAQCTFVARPLPPSLAGMITARGHRLVELPAGDEGFVPPEGDLAHAAWLGRSQAGEAAACLKALEGEAFDWMVVDHYALDERFETALADIAHRVMVIDDLADRRHDCALLLDQNLGRTAGDYDGLVPQDCKRLIGPANALLRPDFAQYRQESLARRTGGDFGHILVSLGGFDRDNVTSKVLDALNACSLPKNCRISVVMGQDAPWIDHLKAKVPAMSRQTSVLTGVSDMARLLSTVDLAVGAAGGSAWERCCLGVPTVLMVLADNQRPGAAALEKTGAAVVVADAAQEDVLQSAVEAMLDRKRLLSVSAAAAAVTDGAGASRVASLLLENCEF